VTEISNDAGRTLMGSHQENWFYRQLKSSSERGATWRLIGSQIVFSRINVTTWFGTEENPYNSDAWDGYIANKNRTLKTLADNNIGNNIMMAGDSHLNWASDLVWLDHEEYDPATGSGALGAEFAGTAVTSNSPFGANSSIAQANNQSSSSVTTKNCSGKKATTAATTRCRSPPKPFAQATLVFPICALATGMKSVWRTSL
jgi:alkaline phosphatase D